MAASLSQGGNHGNVWLFSLLQHKWDYLYLHMHERNLFKPEKRKLWERRSVQSELRTLTGDISVVLVCGVTHHSPPHGIKKKKKTGGKAAPGEVSIHPLLLSLSNNLVSTVCICIYNGEKRDNPAALVCVRTLSWSRLALLNCCSVIPASSQRRIIKNYPPMK